MRIDRPIAIAVILFIILVLVFFFVKPEYKNFRDLQITLAEKKAEYNAQVEYYNAITKTYSDLQAHKDQIKKIDDALPQEPSLGKLVYYLQKTSAENGLIVKSLFLAKAASNLPNDQKNKSEMKDITFSMSVLGDYVSLEKFLVSLEKSSRIFETSSISFGSGSTQQPVIPGQPQFQTQQIYDFSLQIKTHSY
ncbi:MAG: type 4a pilus biogenesis protein PilO [Candidatus Staskawiczbacteria bacterium]|nr:type 4a pilus biogenesis protein PilO [Candidatus Staskawiczbacteria bacterium]